MSCQFPSSGGRSASVSNASASQSTQATQVNVSLTASAVLIRQLEAIRRLAPRLPDACRLALSDQADAILEIASSLVTLDRRDLDAAWKRAHTALEALPSSRSAAQPSKPCLNHLSWLLHLVRETQNSSRAEKRSF